MALTIIVLLVIIISALIGLKRGLFRAVIGTLATVIALVLCYLLTPYTSQFLIENTKIDDSIEEKIYKKFEENVEKGIRDEYRKLAGEEIDSGILDTYTKEYMNKSIDKSEKVSLIKQINIPQFMSNALIANDNNETYEKMGVDNIYRYIARNVAYMGVNVIACIVTFVVIRILLIILTAVLNSIFGSIVLVKFVDKLGGFAAGIVFGVLISWLVMAAASLIMGNEFDKAVEGSQILTFINNKNMLMHIFTNVTDVIFR